ncbi:MAG TPA: methyltransferase domain-containing protein [Pyrinomonadaceae bacterium]|jgi:SAM-dependent methyltransferase|nr:methyltransferase domain-containing protein [Pyrinomonadaceae bacterium]
MIPTKQNRDAEFQAAQMYNNTLAARLFNAGRRVISSEYMVIDHVSELLKQTAADKVIIELGSGNRRLRADVINVDLFPFPNVDVVTDITATPFPDDSVDVVVLDSVLEHVADPWTVVGEIHRVLKVGGSVVCITPFVFPYHGYPNHYWNFSKDGLEVLFKGFSSCRVESSLGPTCAVVNLTAEYFAVAISGSSAFLYTLTKGIALLPIFLLKYVDRLWSPSGRGLRIASHLCAVATK